MEYASDMRIIDVAIMGGGPAGLTAALYAARADLHPVVFEGEVMSNTDKPGGQLTLTTEVENFPGFPDGVDGTELVNRIRAQAVRFDAEIRTTRINAVDLSQQPFVLTAGADIFAARTLIVATGASALLLGVPGEDRLIGAGVSTCATCDAFFFRGDNHVVIVGGGDSAMEEALHLARFADRVTVVHRRDHLRASKIMAERALAHPKISFRWNTAVTEMEGDTRLRRLHVEDTVTGATGTIDCDGVFVAIGHRPATELLAGQVDLDEGGHIQLTVGTATSVPGVFAAGDVADSTYRQAITSAASGCMAALDAQRHLEHHT